MSRKKHKKSAYLNPDVQEILDDFQKKERQKVEVGGSGTYQGHGGWKAGDQYPPGGWTHHKCRHIGDEMIFSHEGRDVYGCQLSEVVVYGADLIIALATLPQDKMGSFLISAPEKFKMELSSLIKVPDLVRLNWEDYKAPNVPLKFWEKLWGLLPQGKILVGCVGGHGRTGTCVGSLMIASGYNQDPDAVIKEVRTVYCDHAIENARQEQYLMDLADGIY